MYKWKPSKTKAREFSAKMDEISTFCKENNISQSYSSDSYYFEVNGKHYRVSNHSVESSPWHPGGRKDDVIYIHASKTRLIEIYNDLKNGYKLNGRGNRI